MAPRFYDRRFNDIPDLTINLLCPGKSYSKLYEAESRFNNIRFNDIPGITKEIKRPKHKFFPVITIQLNRKRQLPSNYTKFYFVTVQTVGGHDVVFRSLHLFCDSFTHCNKIHTVQVHHVAETYGFYRLHLEKLIINHISI